MDIKKASRGKRLANLVIDSICIAIFSIFLLYLLSLIILKTEFHKNFLDGQEIISLDSFILIIAVSYYLIFEGISNKTIGKYLTKTRIIRNDGKQPSLFQIAVRTIIRVIPLDIISFLFTSNGWHDKFSKTIVIEEYT